MKLLLLAFCGLAAGLHAPARPAARTHLPLAAATQRYAQAGPNMNLEQITNTLAGVVAVDGGTIGLEVSFGAFLATILGLFIPVVFLVTLYIQSEAQGTAVSFRMPDNPDGTTGERFDS